MRRKKFAFHLTVVRPCTHYYNIVVEYTDMEVVLRINLYCSRYADNGTESGVKISVKLVLEIEDPTVKNC